MQLFHVIYTVTQSTLSTESHMLVYTCILHIYTMHITCVCCISRVYAAYHVCMLHITCVCCISRVYAAYHVCMLHTGQSPESIPDNGSVELAAENRVHSRVALLVETLQQHFSLYSTTRHAMWREGHQVTC